LTYFTLIGRPYVENRNCFYFLSAVLCRGYAGSGEVISTSQGYVELRFALGRGVRTDIIGFELSIITMVISAGLCLGRTENAALGYGMALFKSAYFD